MAYTIDCPTCARSMKPLGKLGFYNAHWCGQCGTVVRKPFGNNHQIDKIYVPDSALVEYTQRQMVVATNLAG